MVYLHSAVRTGFRIAGKIDKKYNINKLFVDKYVPPGYRKNVNRIFDAVGTLGGGYGIYNAIQSLYAPDSPGNGASIPFKKLSKTGKSYKTRFRQTRCYCGRKRCKHFPNTMRRFSSYRK